MKISNKYANIFKDLIHSFLLRTYGGRSCKNGFSASDIYDSQRKTSSHCVVDDVREPAGYVSFQKANKLKN